MAWIKAKPTEDSYYMVGDLKRVYHYLNDITLDQLNTDNYALCRDNPAYVIEYVSPDELLNQLPAGAYKMECPSVYDTAKFFPTSFFESSSLFSLDIVQEVLNDFENFQSERSKQAYQKINQLYKRGVLLYGPPGTGKTSAITIIAKSLMKKDCLVIFMDSVFPEECIKEFRKDSRLKVLIFEELTEQLKSSRISDFLNFLDGQNSLANCYIIATTNYPEKIDKNLVRRTGRFDRLIQMSSIGVSDRKKYLEYYLERELTSEELDSTKEYSMAFLKELVLLVLRDNISMKEAITQLNTHRLVADSGFKDLGDESDWKDDIL